MTGDRIEPPDRFARAAVLLRKVIRPAALAAVCCLAVLWAVSCAGGYEVRFAARGEQWRVATTGGELRVDNEPEVDARERAQRAAVADLWNGFAELDARLRAVRATSDAAGPADRVRLMAEEDRLVDEHRRAADRWQLPAAADPVARRGGGVHYWTLALMALGVLAFRTAIVLAADARRLRLDSRDRVCAACGYDLRATPDRCPECGAAVVEARPDPSGETSRRDRTRDAAD